MRLAMDSGLLLRIIDLRKCTRLVGAPTDSRQNISRSGYYYYLFNSPPSASSEPELPSPPLFLCICSTTAQPNKHTGVLLLVLVYSIFPPTGFGVCVCVCVKVPLASAMQESCPSIALIGGLEGKTNKRIKRYASVFLQHTSAG